MGKRIRTAVDDSRAGLVVLLLGAPEILEGAEGSQDRSTNPHRVFSLWGSDDLDLHARGRQRSQLLLHTVRNTWEHGGSSGKDDIAVEIAPNVKIALENGVVALKDKI